MRVRARQIRPVPVRQPPLARLEARRRLGERLLLLRRRAGLSQEQVAERVGVTRATVLAWEDGRGEPQIFDAQQLADLYSVGLDVISGQTPLPG